MELSTSIADPASRVDPLFVLVARDLSFLEASRIYPGSSIDERAIALCRALSTSPIWQQMGPGILVVRRGPDPMIAALGRFDSVDLARLEILGRWLETAVHSITYIDYAQVTTAILRLAGKLRDLLGEEIENFDLLPIPRGGLMVYALLSYALSLEGDRLPKSDDRSRPLLIVDDCAITGTRFRQILRENDRRQVIFAHLCSPPELRSALLSEEPALTHVVAAFDLQDRALERWGTDYGAWLELVEGRMGEEPYWIGQTEEIVFPWNEPDHNFWNPTTGEMEWGWRIVPPELCVKNAGAPGIAIQEFAPKARDLSPADHILSGCLDGRVYILDTRNGGTLSLEGVGSFIWMKAMDGAGARMIAEEIGHTWDLSIEQARDEVDGFIEELIIRGVLVESNHLSKL